MRKAALMLLALVPLSAGCQTPDTYIDVPLEARESSGVVRDHEPVTFGVPLPQGRATSPDAFRLLDGNGDPVEASMAVAQRWLDGSIRWLHVHTRLSVGPDRQVGLRLTDASGGAVPTPHASPLGARIEGSRCTLLTGPVKMILSCETPNVIEGAWYDPTGLFPDATQVLGGSPIGTSVDADGQRYMRVVPGTGSVSILEQSDMRLVVLVKGRFGGFNAQAKAGLEFEARVIAYAGSPQVAIDYTLVNRSGNTAADKANLEDLSLRMTVPLTNPTVAVGGARSVRTAELTEAASIHQDTVDHYRIELNNSTVEEGPGKSKLPLTTGWMDLSAGGHGVAIGVRDFWQTFPKKLDARVDRARGAMLRVALYPSETAKAQELYMGQARTHRLTLRFHGRETTPADLSNVFAAANTPLQVVAPPSWYCLGTRAFGEIAPSDAAYGRFSSVAEHYDSVLDASMDSILRQLHEGRTSGDITQDSYGWMNWGDTFFRKAVAGPMMEDRDKNLSWNGNYYDYGFAMICQFYRTGQPRYLTTGLRAGAYTADAFITHYHPNETLIGACHYCPPRYHAALDNGTPYISEECNHAKVASVLTRWLMLGDWWARQAATESFNNALTLQDADGAGWRQCRGNGHRLRILWLAYHFTGEQKYQQRARELLKLGVAHVEKNGGEFDPPKRASQRFMTGVALEGMILHYLDDPDPAVLQAVQRVCDTAREQDLKGYTINMAMAYGFLWKQTGNPAYLATMNRLIRSAKPLDQAKIFGQSFRSTPWAMGYLHEAAEAGVRLEE